MLCPALDKKANWIWFLATIARETFLSFCVTVQVFCACVASLKSGDGTQLLPLYWVEGCMKWWWILESTSHFKLGTFFPLLLHWGGGGGRGCLLFLLYVCLFSSAIYVVQCFEVTFTSMEDSGMWISAGFEKSGGEAVHCDLIFFFTAEFHRSHDFFFLFGLFWGCFCSLLWFISIHIYLLLMMIVIKTFFVVSVDRMNR